jgi:hypothetical protein
MNFEVENAMVLGIIRGQRIERERIIKLLLNLDVIRRDAFDRWVAMDTHGKNCIYLTGLEKEENK